jgi:hypothetical protein
MSGKTVEQVLIIPWIARSRAVEAMLPKAAGLVALCLLIGLGATASAAVAETPSPEVIYGEFKRYRLALADPDLNAVPFFSRHIYEMWGGELLVRRNPVQLMDDVDKLQVLCRRAETRGRPAVQRIAQSPMEEVGAHWPVKKPQERGRASEWHVSSHT